MRAKAVAVRSQRPVQSFMTANNTTASSQGELVEREFPVIDEANSEVFDFGAVQHVRVGKLIPIQLERERKCLRLADYFCWLGL